VLVLALGMSVIALEFPNMALVVAILPSVLGALYQSAGLTFLAVFVITLALTFHWIDMACVVAT